MALRMASRWKHDRPMSRTDFETRFPDDDACVRHLADRQWPDGFVCPACGFVKGWALRPKPHNRECSGCGRQTSVTVGTVMHRSYRPSLMCGGPRILRKMTSHRADLVRTGLK